MRPLISGAEESSPSVLVVDDVHANRVALEGLLDSLDCNVVLAGSGNDALRHLLRRDFAVMLLDVHMPEMDGYEVARHARKNPSTAGVPIIFVTASHHPPDNVRRAYGSGAVDFLFKPVDPVVLRYKVQVFLELYSGRKQLALALQAAEQSYEELQAAQARLVQSEKMASLGQLVAGIAHEINNPLAYVLSHLGTVKGCLRTIRRDSKPEMLEGSKVPWERAQQRLDEMEGGLQRIRDLVLKLRTFSRLEEGERKSASVRECVDSVLTMLGHRMEGRIAVETRFGEPDIVECFPRLLTQAIMNVVANAIDAIDGDGEISIATNADSGTYSIVVTDSGVGVPESARGRLFEPFFTTKPVGEGTGLGLAIAYSIARKHGGSMELDEGDGHGTTMRIVFPLDLGVNA
jgi:two-component system NtrC family sensor kinase